MFGKTCVVLQVVHCGYHSTQSRVPFCWEKMLAI